MNEQGRGNNEPGADSVETNAGVHYDRHRATPVTPGSQTGPVAGPETTTGGYSSGIQPVASHVADDMTTRVRDTDPQSDVSTSQPGVLPNRERSVDAPNVQPPENPQAERANYEAATDPSNRTIAAGMPLGGTRGIETVHSTAYPVAEVATGSPRAVELAEEQRLAVEPETKGSFGVAGEPPSTPSTVSGSTDPMHS